MSYQSTAEEAFHTTVEQWMADLGETSALFHYSRAAGSKSFEFFHSMSAFTRRLDKLSPSTLIEVFRHPQLPLRGTVDEAFINTALSYLPTDAEYLIVGLDPVTYGNHSWLGFEAGVGHAELEEQIRDNIGRRVAFGLYPPLSDDSAIVISAIVPQVDGSVVVGVY